MDQYLHTLVRIDRYLASGEQTEPTAEIKSSFSSFRRFYDEIFNISPLQSAGGDFRQSVRDFDESLRVNEAIGELVKLCISNTPTPRQIKIDDKKIVIGSVVLCQVRGDKIIRLFSCTQFDGIDVFFGYCEHFYGDSRSIQTLVRRKASAQQHTLRFFFGNRFSFEFDCMRPVFIEYTQYDPNAGRD
jgi:hypothetical protein